MEDFERKVKITEDMAIDNGDTCSSGNATSKVLLLLGDFLAIQERRAKIYTKLRDGFAEYMVSGGEAAYKKLCSEITLEFSDCSHRVREMESQFLKPVCFREDLAQLLRAVQEQEKQKLELTATMQILKKAGRPSERLVTHENCKFKAPMQHECVHLHEITEAAGTEEAEADAEYESNLKETIKGVQTAVTLINDHLEEVRYEIASLEVE